MNVDEWALIGIGALVAIMYFVIGLGVARMMGKIKNRDIRIFDVFFWLLVCGVFATVGDCE
jgi:hypothetical protein